MNVVMKNRQKKVLPFPTPAQEPDAGTITIQIANERFAIHYEIEELPLAVPLARGKRPSEMQVVK